MTMKMWKVNEMLCCAAQSLQLRNQLVTTGSSKSDVIKEDLDKLAAQRKKVASLKLGVGEGSPK